MLNTQLALNAFWNSFGIPAYLEGTVPPSATLPYITFRARHGDAFTSATVTAYCWFKDEGQGVNEQRALMLDKIAAAIPPGGKRLQIPTGMIILFRNTTSFQGPYDDPADPSVKGGRTSLIARFLTL